MVCRVIPEFGWLVDGDILELSEFPRPGVGFCHTRMGLGRRMKKELDLKLTLSMAREVIH